MNDKKLRFCFRLPVQPESFLKLLRPAGTVWLTIRFDLRQIPSSLRPTAARSVSEKFHALTTRATSTTALFRRARRVKAVSESYTTSTWSLTFTATNSPSRISAAISSFGRLSWKLASAIETSSGLSVRMCATVGRRRWSVKRGKDSQRVKTVVSGRFYAGFARRIDLLAGEFRESREFRFALNPGLFVLNSVTPGLALQVGRLILSRAVFPDALP